MSKVGESTYRKDFLRFGIVKINAIKKNFAITRTSSVGVFYSV